MSFAAVVVGIDEAGIAVARIDALVAMTISRGAAAGPVANSSAADNGSSATRALPCRTACSALEAHAEKQCCASDLRANAALQHPGGAAAGWMPNFWKAGVEKCVRTGDSDIGSQRQVHPGTHRRTVDGGDSRKLAPADGHETRVDALQAVAAAPEGGKVGACAECLSGSGDDDGVYGVIRFGLTTASRNCADMVSVTALRRSGSFTVMTATRSRTS